MMGARWKMWGNINDRALTLESVEWRGGQGRYLNWPHPDDVIAAGLTDVQASALLMAHQGDRPKAPYSDPWTCSQDGTTLIRQNQPRSVA